MGELILPLESNCPSPASLIETPSTCIFLASSISVFWKFIHFTHVILLRPGQPDDLVKQVRLHVVKESFTEHWHPGVGKIILYLKTGGPEPELTSEIIDGVFVTFNWEMNRLRSSHKREQQKPVRQCINYRLCELTQKNLV